MAFSELGQIRIPRRRFSEQLKPMNEVVRNGKNVGQSDKDMLGANEIVMESSNTFLVDYHHVTRFACKPLKHTLIVIPMADPNCFLVC